MRSTALLAILIAALLLLPRWGASATPRQIVIQFSHVTAAHTPKGMGAERFKQLAEQRTGHRVKVEIYPNSQLYKDSEELQALYLGSVQMLAPSLGKLGLTGVHGFEVFDLPYLIPDRRALERVTDGPVGRALLKRLEPHGFVGLAYWENGFKLMSANRPLRMPQDFRGLKFRIQSSKILDAQMRQLGAIPQVLAFSEIYQALQTGMIDGSENTASNMFTQKHFEVQSHATLSHHGYIGYAVIVNKRFWEQLPPDIRAELESAMRDATLYVNAVAREQNEAALAAMKASGQIDIHVPTARERAAWAEALRPVQDEMAERVGSDLVADIRAAIASETSDAH
ncbi:MAG: DctP family TRAP transporter solute-binding subunit [Steroidobacteraceae bacterium]